MEYGLKKITLMYLHFESDLNVIMSIKVLKTISSNLSNYTMTPMYIQMSNVSNKSNSHEAYTFILFLKAHLRVTPGRSYPEVGYNV